MSAGALRQRTSRKVLLPAPDGPMTASNLPELISPFTSERIGVGRPLAAKEMLVHERERGERVAAESPFSRSAQ